MNRHSISVICLVYNEENRIRRFIESFYKYDEIVIIDKSSTDKTREIARSMGVKVITVPYTDETTVWGAGVEAASGEWVFLLTASDVAHPDFTKNLYLLIDDEEFENNYDAIWYPCIMHVLGIESKYSPFDYSHRQTLGKKSVINITNKIHQEIKYDSDRVYTIPADRKRAIHHLSAETVDMFYEHELAYTKVEIHKQRTYKQCFKEILREVYGGIRKKFWKIGSKGLGLVLLVVNYRILVYLRYLEHDMGDITGKYNELASAYESNDSNRFRNELYKKLCKK